MNTIAEIKRINEAELKSGASANIQSSWHAKYLNSAWIYAGGLPFELTEGDVICVFSQWGEIDDINLIRDEDTGKSKGFCFLKYEDSKSCVLAVDNFNGIKILERTIRVDHVEKYRLPKHLQEKENEEENNGKYFSGQNNIGSGHAYDGKEFKSEYTIEHGQDLFAKPQPQPQPQQPSASTSVSTRPSSESDKYTEKMKRKEARDKIRREREMKRQKKEERKRRKRTKKYNRGSESSRYNTDDSDSSSKNDRKRRKFSG